MRPGSREGPGRIREVTDNILRCNLCKGDEPFRAPHDAVGDELMWAHLEEAHGTPRTMKWAHPASDPVGDVRRFAQNAERRAWQGWAEQREAAIGDATLD